MWGAVRRSVSIFALIGVTALAACNQSEANGPFDTSRLPRVAGAKEVFANAATTIYTVPDAVPQATDAVRKLLTDQGWQTYVRPNTAYASNPNYGHLMLKKGHQALDVSISLAPAQNNATAVNYIAVALPNDLPFPPKASDVQYDYDKPQLISLTGEPLDETLVFYRKELRALGWTLWSAKTGGKLPDEGTGNGEPTNNGGAYAFYVQDGKQPLVLTLQPAPAGKFKVEIKSYPMSVLEAEHRAEVNRERREKGLPLISYDQPPEKSARVEAPAPKTSAAPAAKSDDDIDQAIRSVQEQVRKSIEQVQTDIQKAAPPKQKPTTVAQGATTILGTAVSVGSGDTKVPVPTGAKEVKIDGGDGSLEFESDATVAAMADFYRGEMKKAGWQEHKSVINRPNMVVLEFSKGGKEVSLTVMQMGDHVNVSGEGSALKMAAAKSDDAKDDKSSAKPVSSAELEADDAGGLPVPKEHTASGSEKTPFRQTATATTSADIAAVLAFYRRELGKRNWKEESKGAVVGSDRAVVNFTAPEGPAVLTLTRKNDETSITLALKNPGAAQKAGMLPKAGQAKLLLGNMMPSDAVITIANKTVTVKAGAGKNGPGDGPSLDLPPGKYKYSLKVGGKTSSDEFEVAADQTWGLLVGPGGALPLQLY